jgi:hypothetical protein
MKFKVLTEENFILFAMKHYDNPSCEDADEFYSILKTFLVYLNYIKDNETIDSIELVRIPINTTVANVLREIK